MNWTDERVEKLKKLWSEGLSASQIAAQLGGVSRNAVIGKVHRLSLPGRAKAGGTATPARAAQKRTTSAPRAPNYASRVTTRTVTRQQGATMLKEEIEIDRGDRIPSRLQRRRSDFPPARPHGVDGAHLQVAGRRPAEGRLPFLRLRQPG